MIRLIITLAILATLLYFGYQWVNKNYTETRTQVQCKVDYGLQGCKETPDAK